MKGCLLISLMSIFIFSICPAEDNIMHTTFQTNNVYDTRIDLRTDSVIVHQHDNPAIKDLISSWQNAGYTVYKMFFIGSDAGCTYTEGRADGTKHPDEVEIDRHGNVVMCGTRPYMVPTEGWLDHLRSIIRNSIDAGAQGVMPEEPLAHSLSGYSEGFKKEWHRFYNEAWQPPDSSPAVFWKAAKLHSFLYYNAVKQTAEYTRAYASQQNKTVRYILPVHCLISYAAGNMIFPCGGAIDIPELDGMIGQVWTGPVAWSMAPYEGQPPDRNKRFFEYAYMLYSYFTNLSRGTSKDMYFLADPVEDDPNYGWEEYALWYEQCLVAQLLFPSVNQYEVMPWPDRIFLPGFSMGEGTPGPARYLTKLLLAISILQNMENAETRWLSGMQGIGVLAGDSLGWQRQGPQGSDMNSLYGFIMPFLVKGIPVQILPIERIASEGYLDEFKILLLSYDMWKPLDESVHEVLASWVQEGGILFFSGGIDPYNDIDEWWNKKGYNAPHRDLFSRLNIKVDEEAIIHSSKNIILHSERDRAGAETDSVEIAQEYPILTYKIKDTRNLYMIKNGDSAVIFEKKCGKGWFIYSGIPAKYFVSSPASTTLLRSLLKQCWEEKLNLPYEEPGFMEIRRGKYLISHSTNKEYTIRGTYIDLLSPSLPVINKKDVHPGDSVILFDISGYASGKPHLLYASHSLRDIQEKQNEITFIVDGPEKTFGVARIYAPEKPQQIFAGEQQDWIWDDENKTLFISFANIPKGNKIFISW